MDADCYEESHCVITPGTEPAEGVCYAPKTRFLSIAANPEQVHETARRIKFDDGTELGWVGTPHEENPFQEPEAIWLADIVDLPMYDQHDGEDGFDFVQRWFNELLQRGQLHQPELEEEEFLAPQLVPPAQMVLRSLSSLEPLASELVSEFDSFLSQHLAGDLEGLLLVVKTEELPMPSTRRSLPPDAWLKHQKVPGFLL